MNQEIKEKWVAKLRSGEIKQAKGQLRYHSSMCCLGVLCDILESENWIGEDGNYDFLIPDDKRLSYEENGTMTYPPFYILDQAQLSVDDAKHLAAKNDSGDSFAKIANYIEANL